MSEKLFWKTLPVSAERISTFEERIGRKLPSDYLQFISKFSHSKNFIFSFPSTNIKDFVSDGEFLFTQVVNFEDLERMEWITDVFLTECSGCLIFATTAYPQSIVVNIGDVDSSKLFMSDVDGSLYDLMTMLDEFLMVVQNDKDID